MVQGDSKSCEGSEEAGARAAEQEERKRTREAAKAAREMYGPHRAGADDVSPSAGRRNNSTTASREQLHGTDG